MVDLHIAGRLLIGMGKKLKPVEVCKESQSVASVAFLTELQIRMSTA